MSWQTAQQASVLLTALGGVEFAEVNVPTVDNRTGLARGFVEPISRHGIAGHGVTPERGCGLKVVGRPLSATFPATLPT